MANSCSGVKDVEDAVCPFCKKPIDFNSFTDQLSLKEYKISGLCQKCQDEFFGETNQKSGNKN